MVASPGGSSYSHQIMALRIPKLGRKARVFLGLLLALAVVATLFDWNWFRQPLERYVVHRSHREVRIGDLHVDLAWSLEPTVRLREVYVENAPWASKRPAAVVGEASITFSLRSVWEGRPVISRLVLTDADVNLERQADGLRNWRLRNPDDRGPGKIKVLRLEPHHVQIRLVRRDIGLDIVASAMPSQAEGKGPSTDASHPTRIAFSGEYGGATFAGEAVTGVQLTFLDTGESFPLRGRASTGKTRLDFDGTLADLFKPSAIDGKMRLAGPTLSQLGPFVRGALPASKPYEFESRFQHGKSGSSFADMRGKIGSTDVAGEFSIDLSNERPKVKAALRSESADPSDFIKASAPEKAAPDESGSARSDSRAEVPESGKPGRLFSSRSFKSERLKSFDAHVSLQIGKLKTAEVPELESLKVTADLDHGLLTLKPLDVGLAGGHVAGLITIDAQQQVPSMHAKLDLKEMRLERLLGRLQKKSQGAGPLKGHLDLKGQGDSIAKILASASGNMEISMEGGGISNQLDAKVALNAGKILRLKITGDRAIGINSALVAFDFDKGVGKSKTILLDTDQTRTEGAGVMNLREETVDVLLTPRPKKPGLFSLGSSIRVHGPIRKPEISLEGKAKEDVRAGEKVR